MSETPGLRDRKKAATRIALSEAAARLAKERGIESVTADLIASEAGVSTRTFHNYFSSKEEAVLHYLETQVLEWADALRQRPADEPILDSLEHVVLRALTDSEQQLEEIQALADLIESSPTLLAKKVEMHVRLTPMLDEVIAERTGASGLYPSLLQMVVGAACRASLELWTSGRSTAANPEQLVHEAFDHLRSGLAVPQR
ncbi:TetR/AcrR family transcriptional regulator [Rhodococcus spongiicola]|uniref:TetR family transcriptional regulator n=1 Tax=Rhodococcus spongiicola TaxID=2487352 RepID=A0A438AQS3_9NOCA|nr:TetR/AcrR family transcriptional regulator [Rhodococcus spongiicola]RVW01030.1 TetR family transcriptional regulator [Rhodococcus spongiicola]